MVDDLGGVQMRERGGSGDEPGFALGAGLFQALVRAYRLAEDGFPDAVFLGALDEIEMASDGVGTNDLIRTQGLRRRVSWTEAREQAI